MANIFTVNNKTYTAKEINFGTLRQFGKMGVDIEHIEKDPLNAMLSYFMICSGLDEETATNEITNVDDMDSISSAFVKELDESGFFRSRKETKATSPTTSKQKVTKK